MTSWLYTLEFMTSGTQYDDRGDPSISVNARLRAIVSVDKKDRVRCQQPGCGRSVYAAIHVVEEDGHLMVLGSSCFAERYGGFDALGQAQYGGAGGRKLTDEERQILIQNTDQLLAHFEAKAIADQQLRKQQMLNKLDDLQACYFAQQAVIPAQTHLQSSPWPWQMEQSSIALFTAPDGKHWVRVQHKDRSQKFVPWPQFQGWESGLPTEIGSPDASIEAIAVANIIEAIKLLKHLGFRGPVVGRWQDILPLGTG